MAREPQGRGTKDLSKHFSKELKGKLRSMGIDTFTEAELYSLLNEKHTRESQLDGSMHTFLQNLVQDRESEESRVNGAC
jgi:hypothetical protein